MKKIFVVGILTLVILVVGLSGCLGDIGEVVYPPTFTVIGKSHSEAIEGIDKVGYVEVTIKNTGGDGTRTVYVDVTQGENFVTKEERLYLSNGETETLTFRFSEIGFWTLDPWTSVVRIE